MGKKRRTSTDSSYANHSLPLRRARRAQATVMMCRCSLSAHRAQSSLGLGVVVCCEGYAERGQWQQGLVRKLALNASFVLPHVLSAGPFHRDVGVENCRTVLDSTCASEYGTISNLYSMNDGVASSNSKLVFSYIGTCV